MFIQGNASIFDIFDIGKSSTCNSNPGILHSSLNTGKRLYITHARPGIDDSATFIDTMLRNIEHWPRMSREKILFYMVDT